MRSSAFLSAMVLPLALTGCVNTDPAVFVDPTLTSPSLTVGQSVLESGVTSASFSLDLHLGARAAGPSTVTLGSISVLDSSMSKTFIPSLEVAASSGFSGGTAVVQPDSDVVAAFTLPMTQTLDAATLSSLCGAGGLVIEVSFTDSLHGTTTPAYSDTFQPSGCP